MNRLSTALAHFYPQLRIDTTQKGKSMSRYDDIRAWAEARNLIEGSDPKSQLLKTMSELGELADGINKNRPIEIKDGIGDTEVTLIIIAAQIGRNIEDIDIVWIADHEISAKDMVLNLMDIIGSIGVSLLDRTDIAVGCSCAHKQLEALAISCGLTFEECIEHAWNDIKYRKGRMCNGVFIKEGDV